MGAALWFFGWFLYAFGAMQVAKEVGGDLGLGIGMVLIGVSFAVISQADDS